MDDFSASHTQIILEITAPFANANVFLAMFMLGLMLECKTDHNSLRLAFILIIQRVILAIVIAFIILLTSPFTKEINVILAVTVFAPISALAPHYTQLCEGDGTLAAFTNSVSIMISMIIMSLFSILL